MNCRFVPLNQGSVLANRSSVNRSKTFFSSGASIPEPNSGVVVNIKAYYIARTNEKINLANVELQKATRRLALPKVATRVINKDLNQYVCVYHYGSVVFFNVPEASHRELLESMSLLKSIPDLNQFSEDYKVIVHQNLERPSVIKSEHLNIQSLDEKNLSIVSTIMAQSVALDYYAGNIDSMLSKFIKMNEKIEATGNFDGVKPTELHKLIASNNVILTNVLSRVSSVCITLIQKL